MVQLNPNVLNIAAYPMTELSAKRRELEAHGVKVYDFGTGDPIEPTAEFIRAAVGQGVPEISQYPTVKGLPALRQTICAYVKRRFAVELDSETEVLPCTGAKEAIYNLTFLLMAHDSAKNVMVAPQPGYFVPPRSAAVAGIHFFPFYLNAENGFMLDLAVLDDEVLRRTALAWINYPNNPTGVECTLEYLERQVSIAKKYDILLCSDECYVDVYFGTSPPPSVLQVSKSGVLAFHSCSKRSGMTAYRSGFIAGDASVLKAYAALRDTLGVAAPVYTQNAAIKAWSDDAHVRDRIAVFNEKRKLFIDFFKRRNLEWVKSDASLYFWVKAPAGDGKVYAKLLLEKGIIVTPGEFFAKNSSEYFRIAVVPSVSDCRAALALWESI